MVRLSYALWHASLGNSLVWILHDANRHECSGGRLRDADVPALPAPILRNSRPVSHDRRVCECDVLQARPTTKRHRLLLVYLERAYPDIDSGFHSLRCRHLSDGCLFSTEALRCH